MGNFKIRAARGFWITFENGARVSAQIGPSTYSDNHEADYNPLMETTSLESTTAEIAVIYNHRFVNTECYSQGLDVTGDDMILGYISTGDFAEILDRIRKMTPDELEKNFVSEE